jgi:hypothetical protein
MKSCIKFIAISLLFMVLTGCANLLPSTKVTIESPWKNYDNAKSDYGKIIPGVTTVEDLNKLGITPYQTPNIRILNITEIISVFLPTPAMKIENLDLGIQKCIESKDDCVAYRIEPSILESKRVGSFWLDMFSFKRDTISFGWEFRGLITIVNNVVTYKDPAGGRPAIRTEEIIKKPLGPLQELGSTVIQSLTPSLLR